MKHTRAPRLAGLSARERALLGVITARGGQTVTADTLLRGQAMSRRAAHQAIDRLHRKGWLQRVKRGLYAVVPLEASSTRPALEHAWPLAMELFAPCYVSGWSAAEHWGFTEQIFNSVAIVTGRPQRSALQTLVGTTFRTRAIPATRIFGTTKIWFGSQPVEVADPHRLMIDILDNPELGGGIRHVLDVARGYWQSRHCNPAIVLDYARQYGRGTVFKRLGYTAELFGTVSEEWLDSCRQGLSAGISRLDPAGEDTGRILKRWRLRVNAPVPQR
jgi:predicted transcriptional regulator of viral defense system